MPADKEKTKQIIFDRFRCLGHEPQALDVITSSTTVNVNVIILFKSNVIFRKLLLLYSKHFKIFNFTLKIIIQNKTCRSQLEEISQKFCECESFLRRFDCWCALGGCDCPERFEAETFPYRTCIGSLVHASTTFRTN